jgi:tripartite-type tricarboxylate transporter receptor subunit TctC
MNDFFKRNDIPENKQEEVAGKMFAKFQTMPATPNTPVDSYLDDIYFITHREATAVKTVKSTVKKINDNAKERNSSGEGTGNEDRIKSGSAMPSLDESVRAAFKGVRLDN